MDHCILCLIVQRRVDSEYEDLTKGTFGNDESFIRGFLCSPRTRLSSMRISKGRDHRIPCLGKTVNPTNYITVFTNFSQSMMNQDLKFHPAIFGLLEMMNGSDRHRNKKFSLVSGLFRKYLIHDEFTTEI